MSKDLLSALIIVVVLVFGGLAYLMIPGRLNGPNSGLISTVDSEMDNGTTTIIMGTTTRSDLSEN